MSVKLILAAAWIAGWIHVLWFTPEGGPSVAEFLADVFQSDGGRVDPLVFAVFNLLGLWPLIMLVVLVQDDQGRWKAWPFAVSALVLGNTALYVYLFLRRPQEGKVPERTRLVRFAESKVLALLVLVSTIALFAQGLFQGSPEAYRRAYETNAFVSFMSVDFLLFSVAFAAVLPDDLRRRGRSMSGLHWLPALVPALGAAAYLLFRPPLTDHRGDLPTAPEALERP